MPRWNKNRVVEILFKKKNSATHTDKLSDKERGKGNYILENWVQEKSRFLFTFEFS